MVQLQEKVWHEERERERERELLAIKNYWPQYEFDSMMKMKGGIGSGVTLVYYYKDTFEYAASRVVKDFFFFILYLYIRITGSINQMPDSTTDHTLYIKVGSIIIPYPHNFTSSWWYTHTHTQQR